MDAPTTTSAQSRKRPAAVTIIVILFLLQMPILFTNLALSLWEIGLLGSTNLLEDIQLNLYTWEGELGLLQSIWLALLLMLIILVTYALARLRPWAWTAAMLVLGGRLALGILDFFEKKPYFFIIILYIIPIILLDLEDVRIAFGERFQVSSKNDANRQRNRTL